MTNQEIVDHELIQIQSNIEEILKDYVGKGRITALSNEWHELGCRIKVMIQTSFPFYDSTIEINDDKAHQFYMNVSVYIRKREPFRLHPFMKIENVFRWDKELTSYSKFSLQA